MSNRWLRMDIPTVCESSQALANLIVSFFPLNIIGGLIHVCLYSFGPFEYAGWKKQYVRDNVINSSRAQMKSKHSNSSSVSGWVIEFFSPSKFRCPFRRNWFKYVSHFKWNSRYNSLYRFNAFSGLFFIEIIRRFCRAFLVLLRLRISTICIGLLSDSRFLEDLFFAWYVRCFFRRTSGFIQL